MMIKKRWISNKFHHVDRKSLKNSQQIATLRRYGFGRCFSYPVKKDPHVDDDMIWMTLDADSIWMMVASGCWQHLDDDIIQMRLDADNICPQEFLTNFIMMIENPKEFVVNCYVDALTVALRGRVTVSVAVFLTQEKKNLK